MPITKELESRLRAEWGQSAPAGGKVQLAGQVVSVDAPEDSDLVTARFRVLTSETDIQEFWGRWLRIPENVLQASLALWNPQADTQSKVAFLPVKTDHDRSVGATVGRVLSASWAPATATVPAGIDATLELDRQLNPIVARGVERGILRAVSCSFTGEWAPSHPEMSLDEFIMNYGEVVDGRRVGEICTRIAAAFEVSVVDQGADPFARRVDAAAPDATAPEPTPAPAEETDMWKTLILESLGLAPETDDESVKAALASRLAPQKPQEASATEPVPVEPTPAPEGVQALCAALTAPGVLGTASPADALVRLGQERGEAELLKAALLAAQHELHKLQTGNVLDEAVRLGKVTPAQRSALAGWADRDLDGLKGYLATLGAGSAVPIGLQQAKPRPEDQTSELGSEIKALAKKHGVKPETLKKYLKD